MKQFDLFKKLFLVCFLCAAGAVNAQIHPLAYGFANSDYSNYYANYVGLRVEVNSPAVISGNKNYTVSNDGSGGTDEWGGTVTAPIANVPIYMPDSGAGTGADSSGCSAFSVATSAAMSGKIAVLWRGPLVGACDFACKVLNAQNAGAVAVVLINEYSGQGPVAMGAGTTCTGQTIPVFMIGNTDGIAISGQYRGGTPVNMTLTTWGQNLQNDLGFVPAGIAGWHDYAIPQSQLVASGNPAAYMGMNTAFIANYGTHQATNVSVKSVLTFNGSTIYSDSSAVLHTFAVNDSIYAFLGASSPYTIPFQSSTGEYNVMYTIKQDSTNQFAPDDTMSYSFFSTDSLFSKGRYDFTNPIPQPIRYNYGFFNGGNDFVWGPMYYIAKGGTSLSTVQYSIATAINATTDLNNPLVSSGSNNIYLFKWIDGYLDPTTGTQYPADGIVQNGELQLVSLGVKTFDPSVNPSDTGEGLLSVSTMGDTISGGAPYLPALDANSWYYIAIDVPSSTLPASSPLELGLGCDGVLSPYPRIYGLSNNNNDTIYENSSLLFSGDNIRPDSIYDNPGGYSFPCPAAGPYAIYEDLVTTIDSFNYNPLIGFIPAVAMITAPTPSGIKPVSKPYADISVYPNPAKDYLNVSVSLPATAKTVSYEVIDGLARFVSKMVHYNVQNEVATISTNNLAPGNYWLIITMDDKIMSKKFTVLK